MTDTVDIPAMVFRAAGEHGAAAFVRLAPALLRGCSEPEACATAWIALQTLGADDRAAALTTCLTAAVPDNLAGITTSAAGDRLVRSFFALAEAWRIGGRA